MFSINRTTSPSFAFTTPTATTPWRTQHHRRAHHIQLHHSQRRPRYVTSSTNPRHSFHGTSLPSSSSSSRTPCTTGRRCRRVVYAMVDDDKPPSSSDSSSSPSPDDDGTEDSTENETDLEMEMEMETETNSNILFFGGPSPSNSSSSTAPTDTAATSKTASSDTSIPDAIPSFLGSVEESADLEELPLFPLQLVMTPGSIVPLHIFESRYRLLFSRLRESGTASNSTRDQRFGIVLSSERLALIGCVAEVVRFEGLADGRMLTNNVGRHRFRIVRIVEEKPYIIAKVKPLFDDTPEKNLLPLALEVWKTLNDVLDISNRLHNKTHELSPALKHINPGDDGSKLLPSPSNSTEEEKEKKKQKDIPNGWPCPRKVEDFSFAVCDVLDNSITGQQLLLQMTSSEERLKKQLKALRMARQYLAAQLVIKDVGLK